MKRLVVAALAFAALAGEAGAAGYDDFSAGITANRRAQYELAVASFSAALAGPDLVSAYRPAAYRGRALAYLRQDKCREAQADIKSYEDSRGHDRTSALLRVWSELCLKDSPAARKEFDFLVKGRTDHFALWEFARLEWTYSLFDESQSTARQAFAAADKTRTASVHILLWLTMAAQRAGKYDPAAFAADVAQIKVTDWPRPLLDLYFGKQTPQGVRREASSWRSAREAAQQCQADFYTAEWHIGRNDNTAAVPLLLTVAEACADDDILAAGAAAELKRLGVPLPKE